MSLFLRLIIGLFLILGLAFYYFIDSTMEEIRPRYLEAVEESMNDSAHLLAGFVELRLEQDNGQPSLDISARMNHAIEDLELIMDRGTERRFHAQIYDLLKERMNLSVYITDARGIVIFDSLGRWQGRDFSRMNDVLLTLRGEYGARSSRMVESDPQTGALYVAAPIRYGDRIVASLTVVKPKDSVTPFIDLARRRSLIAALVTAGAIFLFGGLIFLWVSLPVQRLSQYVSDLRAGKRADLPALGNGEIGRLGQALDDLRKQLEGKNYVERYIQTLNHEIKSPLTALRGSVELLETVSADRRHTLVANIQSQTTRIHNMIERMLDLSTVENQNRVQRVDVNLATLLSEQQQTIQGHSFDNQIGTGESSIVRGDSFLLGRAISNLLRNAADFASPGSTIRCSIRREATLAGSTDLILEVENDGPVIPDYALDRVFDRFYSLPRPR
ncbi:MAG: two-component system sensor histidine kinase CreC, partial [Leptospiraceae bacterium]|nr:two-component system sensor histidine kinase CreC [Leptospiraceae bacterium]